jgi:hypothetical protein
VLVRFPFSDLSFMKLRPALVLADAGRGDWVLCQITSNPYAHASVMEAIAGSLKPDKHHQVVNAVVRLISGGS